MDKVKIGERLKRIRQERDLSLEMVVSDLNKRYSVEMSKGTLSKWENDKNIPSLDERLKALIQYYDTSLDYIIGLTDKKTPPHHWNLRSIERKEENPPL